MIIMRFDLVGLGLPGRLCKWVYCEFQKQCLGILVIVWEFVAAADQIRSHERISHFDSP
jgi:hypothetical protein